jgi:hypothetical protein
MLLAFLVLPALLLALSPVQWAASAYEQCGPDIDNTYGTFVLPGESNTINCSSSGSLVHDVSIHNPDLDRISVYSTSGKYCALGSSGIPTNIYAGERGARLR